MSRGGGDRLFQAVHRAAPRMSPAKARGLDLAGRAYRHLMHEIQIEEAVTGCTDTRRRRMLRVVVSVQRSATRVTIGQGALSFLCRVLGLTEIPPLPEPDQMPLGPKVLQPPGR